MPDILGFASQHIFDFSLGFAVAAIMRGLADELNRRTLKVRHEQLP